MITQEQREQFEQLFAKYYDERDYWGDYGEHGVVTSRLKALKHEHEQGRALDISEQDVKDASREWAYNFAKTRLEELDQRFSDPTSSDFARLSEIVRYDQRFTLELCELVAGERFKGLSNGRIKQLLSRIIGG